MATRPTLHIAVAKTKNTASDYNDNFDMMMDFIDNTLEECKDYVDDYMPSVTGQSGKFMTTDGENTSWVDLLGILYPVGGLYITSNTSAVCPIASLIPNSTWEKVASGRVLQGADTNHAAGTTIAAGLPNITGTVGVLGVDGRIVNGAFYYHSSAGPLSNDGQNDYNAGFDASRSNSIYGNSTTVQPPAYVVEIWRRTA